MVIVMELLSFLVYAFSSFLVTPIGIATIRAVTIGVIARVVILNFF
ncbi:17953_t:CDS:2 [Gigaspora margarita]|uniref:17953_t:CDS:1 n=1 Tax=Gigaspora margarita TaxID=4874 RepID=A0ABN7UHT0_GIGMA|nr:17953_t:CDS:2 [Gigaspora margarita]